MVTLLNAPPPKKNIWGRIGASLGEGFQEGQKEAKQSQMAQQLAGQKQANEIDRLKQEYQLRSQLQQEKNQLQLDDLAGKKREQIQNFDNALDIVDRMQKIGNKGNLGTSSNVIKYIHPERQRDIGEYEQLGKSLIQYASNIPIRNKAEFDVLSHDLFDTSLPDAQREGILNAMRNIIEKSKEAVGGESSEHQRQNTGQEPDIDIVRKIYKESGGDYDKAKKMAQQMGFRI